MFRISKSSTIIMNSVRNYRNHHYFYSWFNSTSDKKNLNKPSSSSGLFSVDNIKAPEDFIANAEASIVYCNDIRADIKQQSSSLSDDIITSNLRNHDIVIKSKANIDPHMMLRKLDAISNSICNVIDVATFCTSVHHNHTYRSYASEARTLLSEYINDLNSDISLYHMICHIINHHSEQLSSEERIFVYDMKREYDHVGIHLPEKRSEHHRYSRDDVEMIQNQINELESEYMRNSIENDDKLIKFGPIQSSERHQHEHMLQELNYNIKPIVYEENYDQCYMACSSNKSFCSRLVSLLDNDHFRKQIWSQSRLQPAENQVILGSLIKSRQHFASMIGYPSYSHKYLAANHVLQTPNQVISFLDMISSSIQARVDDEVKILSDLKKKLIRKDQMHFQLSHDSHIYPWDINYLTHMYRELHDNHQPDHMSNDDINDHKDDIISKIRPYFRLDMVIVGLQQLSQHLFGLRFISISPIPTSELWTSNKDKSYGIYKFQVISPSSEQVGILYLDLLQRDYKFQGAGHFTLRCGCEVISQDHIMSQTPIIALALNYPHHPANQHQLPFLSLSQLEVLYHEWGHALHSLLSKTTYQHLSGTRCPVDFAEVPSHLFEYYARNPVVISSWAKHFISKEPIPMDLITEALAKRTAFPGMEIQGQIYYSAVDQEIFGSSMSYDKIHRHSADEVFRLASEASCHMQKKYLSSISLASSYKHKFAEHDGKHIINSPYAQSSMPLLSHTHFIDYGGGYYAYLFAKMYAAQIWHKHFQQDPLSPSSGKLIIDKMMRYGASKPSKEILYDVANGELDPKYYLDAI